MLRDDEYLPRVKPKDQAEFFPDNQRSGIVVQFLVMFEAFLYLGRTDTPVRLLFLFKQINTTVTKGIVLMADALVCHFLYTVYLALRLSDEGVRQRVRMPLGYLTTD